MKQTEFVGSFTYERDCPKENLPEYAFIGRSNVGKSSLINMLCERKNLAHVSQTPGKTQTLNYFSIDQSWFLVDLPGYGYAKVPEKIKRPWGKMIENYLKQRPTLQCAFVLIDVNILPQKIDLNFINWLGENDIPFVLAFTKSDRSKPNQVTQNIANFSEEMLKTWETMPPYFVTSAEKNIGRDDILNFVEKTNMLITK